MARRHVLAASLLLIVGLIYALLTADLPARSLPDTPGPAFFPGLISAAWLVLAGALLFRGIASLRTGSTEPADYRIPARGWIALAAFAIYLVLLPFVGFVAPSIALFAVFAWLYDERRKIAMLVSAVAVPVLLFYLFTAGFQILLPRGPWSAS